MYPHQTDDEDSRAVKNRNVSWTRGRKRLLSLEFINVCCKDSAENKLKASRKTRRHRWNRLDEPTQWTSHKNRNRLSRKCIYLVHNETFQTTQTIFVLLFHCIPLSAPSSHTQMSRGHKGFHPLRLTDVYWSVLLSPPAHETRW